MVSFVNYRVDILSAFRDAWVFFLNMSVLRFIASYLKTRQAVQWWSKRQSMHLLQESHNIRDQLLQQSFTIRRRIERDLADSSSPSTENGQIWLNQLEQFNYSLESFSDRLVPAYSEDSLPLAIQYLVQSWKTRQPQLKFQLDLPVSWKQEPSERNLIIVKILDELLRITLGETSTHDFIHIGLEQPSQVLSLKVNITYQNKANVVNLTHLKDLEYLCEIFQVLTSGKCEHYREDLKASWDFRWEPSS